MTVEHLPAKGTFGFSSVGETVAYKVESKNSGNVDVTGVTITDSVGEFVALSLPSNFSHMKTDPSLL